MDSPRDTYRRLRRLAENPAATPDEQENARRVMASLAARYGNDDVDPAEDPVVEVKVVYKTEPEHWLADHCGHFLGVDVLGWGRRVPAKGGTTRVKLDGKTVVYRGAEAACTAAATLYEELRERVAQVVLYAACGFMHGAMPLPRDTSKQLGPDVPAKPLAPGLRDLIGASANAGRRARPERPELPARASRQSPR